GESDLLARGPGALGFGEVKTGRAGGRAGPAGPLDAIGVAKRRRLRLLAREWLSAGGSRPHAKTLRFDAIGITLSAAGELLGLEHVEEAF
ncbi:MAG: YraN family protein, partial [Solirubrobacterales bacterium]